MMRKRELLADGALALVTFIWGSTFVLVKDIIEQVSPLLLLSVRFTVAALALAAVTALLGRLRGLTMRELGWGVLIGAALWAGYALQTLGLQGTTASNGGFITGLSVVVVPFLSPFFLKIKPDRWAWVGVVACTAGLALLSFHQVGGISLNRGDPLVLGCALAFALQIVIIARVAHMADPFRVATVQVTFAALLSCLAAILLEHPVAGLKPEVWAGAAFLGLAATALAFTVQMSVQRYTSAVHTALIFTLEPVVAAIFGAWLQSDKLEATAWLGAGIILVGMLTTELGPYLLKQRA
ncbi:MAG: DMT family transporter [Chloroflexota bacterium]|nr:DMT family transporter [Chloroflexota bacterium]